MTNPMTTDRDSTFWAGWAAWLVWGGLVLALLAGAPRAQSTGAATDAVRALVRIAAQVAAAPAL